jgi:hypothetical protein
MHMCPMQIKLDKKGTKLRFVGYSIQKKDTDYLTRIHQKSTFGEIWSSTKVISDATQRKSTNSKKP